MTITSLVYYDQLTGAIKAITHNPIMEFSEYAVTRLPHYTAYKFMSGEWDTSTWFVTSDSTPDQGSVRQNQFDYMAVISNELTEVPRYDASQHIGSAITVSVYTALKTVEISVAKIKVEFDLAKVIDLNMVFYLTKRNDPSVVYGEFTVSIKELFESGAMTFTYKAEVRDVSLYTKKIFRFYQLHVKRNKLTRRNTSHLRENRLVTYKLIDKIDKLATGILVIHNTKNNTLNISINGDTNDVTDLLDELSIENVPLFLTHPRDPMVLVDNLSFQLGDITKSITIQIPDHAGNTFGISGYPYMDNLFFMRK